MLFRGPLLLQDSLLRVEVAIDGAKAQPEFRGWRHSGLVTLADAAFRQPLGRTKS